MHHGLGAVVLLGLIAFAFGERAARVFVAVVLIAGAALAVYIGYLIVMDKI